MLAKKDDKPRLIRWIIFLQEFDFEVKDRKRCEYHVADHLSRLVAEKRVAVESEINDTFPNEQVWAATLDHIPWFADFPSYLVSDVTLEDLNFH